MGQISKDECIANIANSLNRAHKEVPNVITVIECMVSDCRASERNHEAHYFDPLRQGMRMSLVVTFRTWPISWQRWRIRLGLAYASIPVSLMKMSPDLIVVLTLMPCQVICSQLDTTYGPQRCTSEYSQVQTRIQSLTHHSNLERPVRPTPSAIFHPAHHKCVVQCLHSTKS